MRQHREANQDMTDQSRSAAGSVDGKGNEHGATWYPMPLRAITIQAFVTPILVRLRCPFVGAIPIVPLGWWSTRTSVFRVSM